MVTLILDIAHTLFVILSVIVLFAFTFFAAFGGLYFIHKLINWLRNEMR